MVVTLNTDLSCVFSLLVQIIIDPGALYSVIDMARNGECQFSLKSVYDLHIIKPTHLEYNIQ